uniref:Minor fimbrium subunit Mfa1 C-terminal domain-containing protein n=1 Tax=Prevotella sp. GTC17260 TaxID=3236796 RepID=A0AB33JFD7_9BACT
MAALVLGLGLLTACSSNDVPDDGGKVATGSTYMSVAINLATTGGAGSRADKQEDKTGEPDNNYVGKWAGQDKIEAIDVYVFNAAGNREANEQFTAGQFQVQPAAGDKSVTVTPSKGIKVEAGTKTVYVVVNPTAETRAHLAAATLTEFKKQYGDVAAGTTTDGILTLANIGNATAAVKTSADLLARVDANKDVITMTAIEAGSVNVAENVSERATLSGDATNRAKLTVKRAVARVMVTTTKDEFKVVGDDPLTTDRVETDAELGTVKNIRYVIAQGETSLYFMQRGGGNENLTYRTPNSEFKPAKEAYKWDDVKTKYDYSGLWKGYVTPGENKISGTPVPTKELYVKADKNATLGKITGDLTNALNGEFILPNTHKWGDTQDASDYRKNNTAYVLVRAQFVPKKVVMEADGSVNENYPAGKTFFMGANGVFYETAKAAQDATKKGVAQQKASEYVNGKTLYYAWINPDHTDTGKWINSPVNRNNIYHIEISGFKRIGGNWNPLVPPVDPNKPNDPNPNNPDPKPNNPNEPNDPPVDPVDPLTPKETWMSVQTTILPWNVHSYSVVLDI